MARIMRCVAVHAPLITVLLVASSVISGDTIPADKSALSSWFKESIKPYTERKGTLDPKLATAEEGKKVIKVSQGGGGDFSTIADAIKSIPDGNTERVIIFIGGGEYKEKVTIERTKPFVTLYGSPGAMPTITHAGTAANYGTVNSATLIVLSDYFVAANIIFENSSPKPAPGATNGQALALRISGDKAAFHNCKFVGFQDTLCDDKGHHFFKDCHIAGTVDFIFGSGTSIYLNTELSVVEDSLTVITAQGRQTDDDTGFSFVHCSIIGSAKGTFLGRAWMPKPRVIYSYTTMGSGVNPLGWSDNFHPDRDKTVFYGEYQNSGPGSSVSGRVPFSKKLTAKEAQPFLTLAFIQGSSWLLPPPSV